MPEQDNAITLTPNQIDLIAQKVVKYIKPQAPVADPTPEIMTEYANPTLKRLEELELETLEAMPTGTKMVVGKRGTTMVNHSLERLRAIQDFRRDKTNIYTKQRI